MYLILHGFSRRNQGDGLLVDLTLEALEAAGIAKDKCQLLALDPDSFSDLTGVHQAPGEVTARPTLRLAKAFGELLLQQFGRGTVSGLVSQARGIVAVGGGYLVADSAVRKCGVLLNHFAQLRAAARSQLPTVYMPQSIGPLYGAVGRITKHHLQSIDRLYVRDDQSFAEVGGPNVIRCGDLAVMKLARELPHNKSHARGDRKSILVARELPRPQSYVARLRELEQLLQSNIWAVQSDVQGPRSDRKFYGKLNIEAAGSLETILRQSTPSVVISVRLHGALSALLFGVPAIHLAYERKGWGAYEDLGIAEYVHDARTFDPIKVAAQVAQLQRDSIEYWAKIRGSAPKLQLQYSDLVSDLTTRMAS